MFFSSEFMPCSGCGESIDRSASVVHQCNRERVTEFQMFGLRDEIAAFDGRLRQYLHTATGRFEVWQAARQVRKGV